jgi:pyruvate kinase
MIKILPTIGPVSDSTKSIKKILKFTDTIRLNGSHNLISWHVKVSSKIKSIKPNCKILIDLPGVKPRTENLEKIIINKNQRVIFFFNKKPFYLSSKKILFIKISNSLPIFSKVNFFSVSDGKYILRFIRKGTNYIEGISLQTFFLLPKQGINIPNSLYSNNNQLKFYINFIKKIKKAKFDAIGLSFIQDEIILKILKKKFPKLILVSKIENLQGLKNIDNITEYSDVVMIDRGDLSAEIGEIKLFDAIVNVSEICRKKGKPLIIATGNLESMINNTVPSKSEVISLAFLNQIKTDQIMLSEETATSKNYLKILLWLKNFINFLDDKNNQINFKNLDINNKIFDTILSNLNNTSIIIFTKKGHAINKILKVGNNIKIYIFSDNNKIVSESYFRSNCVSFLTKKFPKNMDKFIFNYIKKNKHHIFNKDHSVFLTYLNYPKKGSRANTLSLISKRSFF